MNLSTRINLLVAGAFFVLAAMPFSVSATAQQPNALSETYTDWIVRCQMQQEAERRCWIVQTLRRDGDGELVLQLEFTMVDGDTALTMLAPFGVLLTAGVQLTIDGERADALDFRTCFPRGCVVQIEPDDGLLAALRSGDLLTVGLIGAQTEEPFDLQLSLRGFTAAHNRLRALANE